MVKSGMDKIDKRKAGITMGPMKNFSAKYSGKHDEASVRSIHQRYKGIEGNWIQESEQSSRKQNKSSNLLTGVNDANLDVGNLSSIDKAIHQSAKFFNNRKREFPNL